MPLRAREEIKVFSQEGGSVALVRKLVASVALVRKLVAIVGHRCGDSTEAGGYNKAFVWRFQGSWWL